MIKNKTKGTILCNESKILNTLFSKARGLMFHKKIRNLGLIFVFDKPKKIKQAMLLNCQKILLRILKQSIMI